MIASHIVTNFRRFGVSVDECLYLEGEPYFSAEAIGKFLGFSEPRKAINKIIERNPFITEFSKTIKVLDQRQTTSGGILPGVKLTPSYNSHLKSASPEKTASKSHSRALYKKRFFDLQGFFLIAQKSHTRKAIRYQLLLARLGKLYMQGKLIERTAEEKGVEGHLETFVNLRKGYGIRHGELKNYMKKTGCSRATAYRHAAIVRSGGSPFDKDWKNCQKPAIDEDLGLRIRELYLSNPEMKKIDIWREIGEKPSYTTVREYLKKVDLEIEAANGN